MTYDHIVVGAGTAGCVLAGRLSEAGRSVLLIEAGGRPSSPFVNIPAGFTKLFKTKLDWAFQSEPGSAIGGRRIFTPRGKMLGGSSNMNAQIHQWCHPADFDQWPEGWSWTDVKPTFRDQENWRGTPNPERGTTGPLIVSPNENRNPLTDLMVASARSVIGNSGDDYNGTEYEGAWACQIAHDRGKRFSCYHAYLKPAMSRPNLTVLTNQTVARVVIENGRAVGVETVGGRGPKLHRSENVILAAGAIGSPHILMLSGIGPEDELRSHGISLMVRSEDVGNQLQDHPIVPLRYATDRRDTLKSAESPLNLLNYIFRKRGMLATNAIEAFAFARSRECASAAPDIEILFTPLEWRGEGMEAPKVHGFSLGAIVAAPVSRGSVRLGSADPTAAPKIDFGLLTDPDGIDKRVMTEAVKLAHDIASASPLVSESAGALDSVFEPGGLEKLIRSAIQTVYHPSSTCRMGTDAGAVVDPELRVNGVEGLQVADASVMPSVPRGHPNAVVAMIANRLADQIIG